MRIHSVEETAKMAVAKGRVSRIAAMLSQLQPGESLEIRREDWLGKRPPWRIVNYYAKKSGHLFDKGRLHDKSGWLVKRVG
jgi:hypothetical protein